jgi:phosphoglucomutase
MTILEAYEALCREVGWYRDGIVTKSFPGLDGMERMRGIMQTLREHPLTETAGLKVLRVRDYQTGLCRDTETGEESPTGLPRSNVLYYELKGDAWCCIRPSGTEPKIKIYFGVRGAAEEEAAALERRMREELSQLI